MKKCLFSLFVVTLFFPVVYSQIEVGTDGNVGIGASPGPQKLMVHGTMYTDNDVVFNGNNVSFKHIYNDVLIDNSGFMGKGIRPEGNGAGSLGTDSYRWYSVYTMTLYEGSDERLKENIRDCNDVLSLIKGLRPVKYDLRLNAFSSKEELDPLNMAKLEKERKDHIGFIAQEVMQVIPEVVSHSEEDDSYSISYTRFIPILVKAIQEQQKIIEEQNLRIEKLYDRISDLK